MTIGVVDAGVVDFVFDDGVPHVGVLLLVLEFRAVHAHEHHLGIDCIPLLELVQFGDQLYAIDATILHKKRMKSKSEERRRTKNMVLKGKCDMNAGNGGDTYGPKVEDHNLALEVSGESEVLPSIEPLDLDKFVPAE